MWRLHGKITTNSWDTQKQIPSLLSANSFADQIGEITLGSLAELIVMRGFLADHESSAAVARIEPFRGRCGLAAGAIKAHTRAHLDKRTALGKCSRFLVFDPNQRHPLIVLEHSNRAH